MSLSKVMRIFSSIEIVKVSSDMIGKLLISLFLLLSFGTFEVVRVQAGVLEYVPDEIIVKLRANAKIGDLELLNSKYNFLQTRPLVQKRHISSGKLHQRLKRRKARASRHIETPRLDKLYLVQFRKGRDVLALVEAYNQSPYVEFAEPNYILQTSFVPDDHMFGGQWAHQNTEAVEGWDLEEGDPDVVIAIIDTGVDFNHPDLMDNIWTDANGNPGKDFVQVNVSHFSPEQLFEGEDYTGIDNDPSDFMGHGTGVAGVAAARGNNGIGVAGVCWQCQIMPVRAGYFIFDHDQFGGHVRGFVETSDMIPAITFAVDSGADIINLSVGGAPRNQSLEIVLNVAASEGVFIVGAAGNGATDTEFFPAAYNDVFAVASSDSSNKRVTNSNFGEWVDVAAPGDGVLSTRIESGYGNHYGTSFAAPYVSGLAGLLLSQNPNLTLEQMAQVIRENTDELAPEVLHGTDVFAGTGVVNVRESLEAVNNIFTVEFSTKSTIGIEPFTVDFINQTTFSTIENSSSDSSTAVFLWDFGDGATSTARDPRHVYNQAGVFTVSLTVTLDGRSDTKIKEDFITVHPQISLDFSASTVSGTLPLTVDFVNETVLSQTASTATFTWDFGDGATSSEQNPQHVYNQAGVFTVSLTITIDGFIDTIIKEDFIAVNFQPVADFSAIPTSGIVPLITNFSNTTNFSGAASSSATFHWDFGDGGSSNALNPQHVFSRAGMFTVTHTVTVNGVSDTIVKEDFIAVNFPLVADFSAAPTSGAAPLTVNFTNKTDFSVSSSSSAIFHWDFGDGSTSSVRHPQHVYSRTGVFTVSHTVAVDGVSDTTVKPDFVNTIAPPVAGFTHKIVGFRKLDVLFTNTSNSAISFRWDFGDNTPKSTLTNPSHTYSKAGNYTVTLQAFSEPNQKGNVAQKKEVVEAGRFLRRSRSERMVLDNK